MKLYNTLSSKIEELEIENNFVRMYACGPTVYNLPHLGNYRTFFLADMLRRWLRYRNYNVFLVMNLTDIDDKTIRDSAKEGLSLKDFTEKYTKEFFRGCEWLNIEPADVHPKATEHTKEMFAIIQKLMDKGIAYEKGGSVYYSLDKFPEYGKLSHIQRENLKIGASVDVDEYDKNNPSDFVLWKASTPEEIERNIFWESPWGRGRCGWHIECSAMNWKYLGQSFDLHLGGVDLIFPHHENEIAQSEGAFGAPFVRYWVHGEHLIVDGKKMSKSLGNFFTLDDLAQKYDFNTVRLLFLSSHYREKLNYTETLVTQADAQRVRIKGVLDDLQSELSRKDLLSTTVFTAHDTTLRQSLIEYKDAIITVMDNDFQFPAAMQNLNNIVRVINTYLQDKSHNYSTLVFAYTTLRELLDVFGLFPEKTGGFDTNVTEALIQKIIDVRNDFRKEKQWKAADKLRDMLKELNIELKDLPDSTRWYRSEGN